MEIFRSPNILFIRGVFLNDIQQSFDQIVDDKYARTDDPTGYSDAELSAPINIGEMPKVFTGLGMWPRETNLKCATCFGDCNNSLVFIPKYIDRTQERVEWGVIPIPFNSFPCAAFHIEWFMDNDQQHKTLLAKLYREFTGVEITEVISGQPPWRLREIGGDLSRSEYMLLNATTNENFNNTCSEYQIARTLSESHIQNDWDNEDDIFDDDTENTILED